MGLLELLNCAVEESECCNARFYLLNDSMERKSVPHIKLEDRSMGEVFGSTTTMNVQVVIKRDITTIESLACCLNGKYELDIQEENISVRVHLYGLKSISITQDVLETFNAKLKITIN